MGTRDTAVARALAAFDGGGFRDRLAALVAIPSTSQDPNHAADVRRYLEDAIRPWLERMGFAVAIHPNPEEGFGPILTAERLEDPSRPTILTYGHGDTVRGLENQWRPDLDPWRLHEDGDRWYGRGTADNKGQHALNLTALEAVLAERGDRLGFNLKLVLETGEERGSVGLRKFVAANRDQLAADVLIGSDGPRVAPEVPTIATGTRGPFHFDLVENLRLGQLHRARHDRRPAGESRECRGAERTRTLPDPIHRRFRSGRIRRGTAPTPGRGRVRHSANRKCRYPHAGKPHRSGASLGALGGCQ